MKYVITLTLGILIRVGAFSQGTWTQKANFGGLARNISVGFSIGSKGYIGTGNNSSTTFDDFWEYNPTSDSWSQKANFPPGMRTAAVGFSIGSKGYIGTGQGIGLTNDFWEYNQAGNTWSQKVGFPGAVRQYATGFSIGTKGYIGMGRDNSTTYYNDFWEYDQAGNAWIQIASFPGVARWAISGFSIGTKGYFATGLATVATSSATNEFWEWNQSTNTWTQKANFLGTARYYAVGFSIGGKGYIGTGADASGCTQDFYEYDTLLQTWSAKANFAGAKRDLAVGFSIGTKGYIGTGFTQPANLVSNDFWEWTSSNVGINESNASQYSVSVYPNPIISSATIEIENNSNPDFDFIVYDVSGKEAKSIIGIKANKFSFERAELKNGIYFYSLCDRKSNKCIGNGKLLIN